RQLGLGGFVFGRQPRHQFAGGGDVLDRADALAAAPDVAPGLGLLVAAGAEIHLRGVGRRQVVGVEAGGDDGGAQVVAVHAGEEVGVDDVVAAAGDDHVLVALHGARLLGGDE